MHVGCCIAVVVLARTHRSCLLLNCYVVCCWYAVLCCGFVMCCVSCCGRVPIRRFPNTPPPQLFSWMHPLASNDVSRMHYIQAWSICCGRLAALWLDGVACVLLCGGIELSLVVWRDWTRVSCAVCASCVCFVLWSGAACPQTDAAHAWSSPPQPGTINASAALPLP